LKIKFKTIKTLKTMKRNIYDLLWLGGLNLKRKSLLEEIFDFNPKKMYFPDEANSKFEKIEEEGEDESLKWKIETWKSSDGKTNFTRKTFSHKNNFRESEKHLNEKLELAVKEQRFEDAAILRDKINELKAGN
jgi:excinuclease UvrABC helicase subunit UvrB